MGSDARNAVQTVIKVKINVKFIVIAQLVGWICLQTYKPCCRFFFLFRDKAQGSMPVL